MGWVGVVIAMFRYNVCINPHARAETGRNSCRANATAVVVGSCRRCLESASSISVDTYIIMYILDVDQSGGLTLAVYIATSFAGVHFV